MSINNKIVLSLIPAKKKSSRFKNKNIKRINGKMLFEITLINSLKSKYIDKTYVSSDSLKILKRSKQLGAEIIKRPIKFCTINSNADEVILHFIKKIPIKLRKKNPFIIYLQPTSPLRSLSHINKSLLILEKNSNFSLISVFKEEKKDLFKSFYLNKGQLKPIFKNFLFKNDQLLPNIYFQNGAIYIFTINSFMRNKKIPDSKIIPFFMKKKDSLDINYKQDFKKIKKSLI